MFVHYNGSISEFKSASDQEGNLLSEKYYNNIVFIKGSNGESIYTHGNYYGDVKEALVSLQAQVTNLKYFTGIKKAGAEETAWAADKNGVITFNTSDPASIDVDITAKGVIIGLNEDFLNKVNDTASLLGEANAEANADASAFARIKNLENIIDNLQGQDGIIKQAVAEGIASVVADADTNFDTLKEIADWITNDSTGAASMQSDITTLKGDDTVEGSIAKQVKDAVTEEAIVARAAEEANASAIATKVSQIEYNTKIAELEELWSWEEL